jgi:hypothetical protein
VNYLTSEHDNLFQSFISTIKDDLLYTPNCREFSFEMLLSQNLNSVKTLSCLNDIIGLSQADHYEDAQFVKESLIEAGLFINEDKSFFNPITKLERLGIVWNSTEFTLSIPERRVYDLMSSLSSSRYRATFPPFSRQNFTRERRHLVKI